MAKIAVIVTCYNLGRTLEQALDSVLAQTRPANEIVVVDDGSTDLFTRQYVAQLERARMRVVQTANRGVSAARNLGIGLTSAPYVVLLDADDWFDPSYFEKAASKLDADTSLDFVSCAQRGFGQLDYIWKPPPCDLVEHVTRGPYHVSTMFRRKVWEAVGGFQEDLPADEEMDFWTSVLEHRFRGEILDEPLLNYRVRPESMYHQLLRRETYLTLRERFYQKHSKSLEPHFLELLIAKESMILEQRSHSAHLVKTKAGLEQELASLRVKSGKLGQLLAERGVPCVEWGDLDSIEPISPYWGVERGQPINRYYIEKFLERHKSDIRGHVLEIKDPWYTRLFGANEVARSEVLDIDPLNSQATIVADLTQADAIPSNVFDCFILTQTLNFIYNVRAALLHSVRILKPGGVLLATVSALDRISYETGPDGDYWRFTEASLRTLLTEHVPLESFEVTPFGNVKACMAYLYGLSSQELDPTMLDVCDPWFPIGYCIRAIKPAETESAKRKEVASQRIHTGESHGGAILMYHRIADLRPDTYQLCVQPSDFRHQMEHLHRNYNPMALEDLARAATEGRIPRGAVAVTFDDGYLDSLETATPILAEFNIPAAFFINTERLEEEHEFWWDTLERIFISADPIPPVLELQLGGKSAVFSTTTVVERESTHVAIRETVYRMFKSDRDEILRRLVEWSGFKLTPRPSHRPMMCEEIRRLAGWTCNTIGGHTTHHLMLPAQPLEIQEREIVENKKELELMIERPVSLFAYPYGEYDMDTVKVVRSASFQAAVTVEEGIVFAGVNPLLLPRFEMKNCDRDSFARRMKEIFGRTARC
jgi:glycosyltransferase involved in cell wall biosynthesis/peptidoglycan/xylan/chitin deacetylase (PgdA/CDA1 family)